MRWQELVSVAPGRGEALVRQTAVGLNFIDIYERTGLYGGQLPTGLGREAAGVVEAVGPGVRDIKAGDRVAYASTAPGAYADERVMPVGSLVPVPLGAGALTFTPIALALPISRACSRARTSPSLRSRRSSSSPRTHALTSASRALPRLGAAARPA